MEQDKVKKLVERCCKQLGSNKLLAEFLGSHERTVYRWLAGETKPSAEYTMMMCELVFRKNILSKV